MAVIEWDIYLLLFPSSDSGYKDHNSIRINTELPHSSYVSSIVQSDAGVWTSFAHSPFVILWDSISLLRKTSISLL